MNEQIRDLENKGILSGRLMELTVTEKADVKGREYIRLKGVVQYGDSSAFQKPFTAFEYRLKVDGTPSKMFPRVQAWAHSAVPATQGGETYVTISGLLEENNYVASSGELREGVQFRARFFNEYDNMPRCGYDLEGVILAINEEVKNDVPTGRLRVGFFTMDGMHRPVVLKRIVVPEEKASAFQSSFRKGDTLLMNLDAIPNRSESNVVTTSSAFGQARQISSGKTWTEDVVVGCFDPYPEEDSRFIPADVVRTALTERNTYLQQVKEKGYSGGAGAAIGNAALRGTPVSRSMTKSAPANPVTTPIKTPVAAPIAVDSAPSFVPLEGDDDDDMPF